MQELGVSIVWLMPVHPVGVQARIGADGDPYAVRDFTAIDPALGDAAGLRALVDDLHRRGMRVIYDWTLNRASVDNVLTASHPEWFTHDAARQAVLPGAEPRLFHGFDFSSKPLRAWLLAAMQDWITAYGFDGLRFDDADITPLDFLDEIRAALVPVRADIALIAQSTDELHHLDACDLTYDGGARETMLRIAQGEATADAVRWQWEESTYTFPRGAAHALARRKRTGAGVPLLWPRAASGRGGRRVHAGRRAARADGPGIQRAALGELDLAVRRLRA
ncbi:hypothetical protein LP419_07240 [Massilia sp. H-1]|nr:hypothetical protein LP419_07240 [Massilia sp. H-1]